MVMNSFQELVPNTLHHIALIFSPKNKVKQQNNNYCGNVQLPFAPSLLFTQLLQQCFAGMVNPFLPLPFHPFAKSTEKYMKYHIHVIIVDEIKFLSFFLSLFFSFSFCIECFFSLCPFFSSRLRLFPPFIPSPSRSKSVSLVIIELSQMRWSKLRSVFLCLFYLCLCWIQCSRYYCNVSAILSLSVGVRACVHMSVLRFQTTS